MNNLQIDPKRFAEIAFGHFEELCNNRYLFLIDIFKFYKTN